MRSRIQRREFLKLAGGAVAVSCFGVRPLTGAVRPAPSKRLAIGVIGIKKMGGEHVGTLLGFPDVQLVAVCDVDAPARERVRAKIEAHYAAQERSGAYVGCAAYNEYEALLARPDIDGVIIATPEHWHAQMAIAACRAGKDVYCEKPLSLTIRAGRAMVDAARRYGTVFQTGMQQRSWPAFRRACELVRSGYIGAVRRVHVGIGPCSEDFELPEEPAPRGLDWDRWLGPAPWAPFNRLRIGSNYADGWRKLRDYSGGKMTDWGAHYFDIVQWGLGMDDSGPVEVIPPACDPQRRQAWHAGFATRNLEGAGVTRDDPSFGLTFRYANGVTVIKDDARGIRFVGTEGEVEVDREHLRLTPESLQAVRLTPGDVHLYESTHHHQDWFDCMRTRRRPITDVEIGCRSVSVCHLGNIALWTRRAIQWDPAGEQIVGDAAAARWLGRPARAPYGLPI